MEYVQTKYKELIWLPFSMVESSIDNSWERTLVFFIMLRKVHKKPTFYNYTLRDIASQMDCSYVTVKKHLDILKEKGMVYEKGKHLCLTGTNNLLALEQKRTKKEGYFVPVKYSSNKKDQITYLRYVLIKRNLRSQERGYNLSLNAILWQKGYYDNNPKLTTKNKVNAYRRRISFVEEKVNNTNQQSIISSFRKQEPLKKIEEVTNSSFNLSNKKFGSISNRGQLTGLKIQKELNRLGLIESKAEIRYLKEYKEPMTRSVFFAAKLSDKKYLDNSYVHSKNGMLYQRLPNSIIIKT